jgi:acetyl esterase/lipase
MMRINAQLCAICIAISSVSAPRCFAQDAISITPDVVYGHKDGMALTFDVFQPKENAKGIGLLFMVSGGWVSAWTEPTKLQPMIQPLLAAGYTVFAVRHGSSPRYLIPEIAVDVRSALKFIHAHAADYKVDSAKLGVFGFSAGGHLSLLLGTMTNDQSRVDAPHVAAVVAVFPPTDLGPYVDPKSPLREQFPALKFDPAKANDYSPLMHVTADDAPTLLVHGDKDELVPIWHSQKIAAAFAEAKVPAELITIEGAAHGFNAEGNKRMMKGMVEWFDKYLADVK